MLFGGKGMGRQLCNSFVRQQHIYCSVWVGLCYMNINKCLKQLWIIFILYPEQWLVSWKFKYRVSQELRSVLLDLIPELMLSQKHHIHMGPIRNGSGVMSFGSTVNKLERLRWSRGERVQTRPKPSDFSGEKILSAPSFGGEVKPSIQCRKFTACKRTKKWRGSCHFRQNSRQILAHSSTFHCCGSLTSFQTWGTPGGGNWNVLITGPSSWGFDVPLATALCKNLPAENTQR